MKSDKVIKVNKLDAAISQTITAIELYFQGKDSLSVHTLAAAAYNIFKDLSKKHGTKLMLLKQSFPEILDAESRKKWMASINRYENYLKHADTDSDKELAYNPLVTEFVLADLCGKMQEIFQHGPPIVMTYMLWFMAKTHLKPKIIKENKKEFVEKAMNDYKIGKNDFYKKYFPVAVSSLVKIMKE